MSQAGLCVRLIRPLNVPMDAMRAYIMPPQEGIYLRGEEDYGPSARGE
jgi:hypothetical protein